MSPVGRPGVGPPRETTSPPRRRMPRRFKRLIDGGAVILGKTTTQEFAAGTISPPARNPWNPSRIPGGSSGGSAAAVAVGACLGAMGSDTGGSIRIPAAACGVTGFKPAFGQLDVSRSLPAVVVPGYGRTDCAYGRRRLDHVEGAIRRRHNPHATLAPDHDERPRRIGIPRSFFFDSLHQDVRSAIEAAIEMLRDAGLEIVDTPWPDAAAARACGFVINRVETAAVHERAADRGSRALLALRRRLRLRVAAGRTIPATVYLKATRARASLQRLDGSPVLQIMESTPCWRRRCQQRRSMPIVS